MHGIALPVRRCKVENARQSYQDEPLLSLTFHDHIFHPFRSKISMADADEISISLFPSGEKHTLARTSPSIEHLIDGSDNTSNGGLPHSVLTSREHRYESCGSVQAMLTRSSLWPS
jgi:hypothetical protein